MLLAILPLVAASKILEEVSSMEKYIEVEQENEENNQEKSQKREKKKDFFDSFCEAVGEPGW